MDRGNVGKKLDRHIDRHVQHVVDVLPFVFDFERLPIITVASAGLAGDIDIGRKFISIVCTPAPRHSSQRPPFTLKEKRPCLEPSDLGVGRRFEQLADVGKRRSNRSPDCSAASDR